MPVPTAVFLLQPQHLAMTGLRAPGCLRPMLFPHYNRSASLTGMPVTNAHLIDHFIIEAPFIRSTQPTCRSLSSLRPFPYQRPLHVQLNMSSYLITITIFLPLLHRVLEGSSMPGCCGGPSTSLLTTQLAIEELCSSIVFLINRSSASCCGCGPC